MLEIALEIIWPKRDEWSINFFPALQLTKDNDRTALHLSWLFWGIGISFEETGPLS